MPCHLFLRMSVISLATMFSLVSAIEAQEQQDTDILPPEMPCIEAVITGVGGPPPHLGKAQSGVFVRYGTIANECDEVRIQFDAGRGTLMRLSQIKAKKRPGFITPQSLDALFITHAHSDHTSSLPDIISTRWILSKNDGQFSSTPPPAGIYSPLKVVCPGTTCDVVKRATDLWKKYEIPGRKKSDYRTTKPQADIVKFSVRNDETLIVWEDGDIKVSAVNVPHIRDSVGYLISSPAGNICISGDTGLSQNLASLCDGADILIHDSVHSVLKALIDQPPKSADPKFIEIVQSVYKKHTDPIDMDLFNDSVSTIVMTHMTPAVGAGGFQGVPLIPYLAKLDPTRKPGPLRASDFCKSLKTGGFKGAGHIAVDLMKIRLVDGEAHFTSPADEPTNCDEHLTD